MRERTAMAKAQGATFGGSAGGIVWALETLTGVRLNSWISFMLALVVCAGLLWGFKQGGFVKIVKKTVRLIQHLRRVTQEDGRQIVGRIPGLLAALAIIVGGGERSWRAEEFLADLTGSDRPSGWAQVRYSGGLVRGAAVMRTRDLCRPLMRLVDWVLAKPRTERLAATAAIATACYFVAQKGISGLLGNLENVAAAAGLLYGPGVWLRSRRGVPPVPPRKDERQTTRQ